MEKALGYQDVYLVPRYSEARSRADIDVGVEFLGWKFLLPVTPANMASVINENIAKSLSESGYFYAMHRFGDTMAFVKRANEEVWRLISISVGVKGADKELIRQIIIEGLRVDFICVDIAHGHSLQMKEMIAHIKQCYSESKLFVNLECPKIIAGNVASPAGVEDLATWGADAVKVGIGSGGICSTKDMTGFHVPMFSCVNKCVEIGGPIVNVSTDPNFSICGNSKSRIPIIADGGVRTNGDVAKALAVGAQMVMLGGMFAACTDAPGDNLYTPTLIARGDWKPEDRTVPNGPVTHKRYWGSASERQKHERKHVEGFERVIECSGLTIAEKLSELTESLRSSASYAGGSLAALKGVEYVTTK